MSLGSGGRWVRVIHYSPQRFALSIPPFALFITFISIAIWSSGNFPRAIGDILQVITHDFHVFYKCAVCEAVGGVCAYDPVYDNNVALDDHQRPRAGDGQTACPLPTPQ